MWAWGDSCSLSVQLYLWLMKWAVTSLTAVKLWRSKLQKLIRLRRLRRSRSKCTSLMELCLLGIRTAVQVLRYIKEERLSLLQDSCMIKMHFLLHDMYNSCTIINWEWFDDVIPWYQIEMQCGGGSQNKSYLLVWDIKMHCSSTSEKVINLVD